jgi:hypothetical protein
MDLRKSPDICDGQLVGGDSHDGSVFEMKVVYVKHPPASDNLVFEDEMSES